MIERASDGIVETMDFLKGLFGFPASTVGRATLEIFCERAKKGKRKRSLFDLDPLALQR